ncbi:hypothetical protein BU251_08725 [Candidatus Velamenicoccus archaeovorus]|uniref:SIR2-like domain-containing protein n=1 Tax=Velamenicoccus archaeovorus TaxID=1930593 RepID=A0A410P6I2_VELA1|nr:hypothetical protein [Candidatus Velamenicoccus archaeovorus]QAT17797.1 hypothetical protein BU251_08725 [Candidatus Velamenicoccus archaeovorus]
MKRIFMLGAGFSVPAGLPAISNLFAELRRFYCEDLRDRNLPCLQEFEKEYAVVDAMLYPSGEPETNFEKFISLLDAGLKEGILVEQYSFVRKGWLLILAFYLNEKVENKQRTDFYNSFVARLNPAQDLIFTFNWDCLLESVLDELGIGWQYRNTQGYSGRELTIYKLHGSVNWFFFPPHLRPRGDFYKQMQNDDISKGRIYYCALRGLRDTIEQFELQTNAIPFIVPPTYFKVFEGIHDLWSKAFEELKKADEINIIGYSFPELDFFAELTIRMGISSNRTTHLEEGQYIRPIKVKVFDQSQQVADNIGKKVSCRGLTFEPKQMDFLGVASWDGSIT